VADQALLLHHLEEAQDGGIRQLVVGGCHSLADITDRCLAALPQYFEGFELAVGWDKIGHDGVLRVE
jgi:hypothetical protein